MTYYLGMSPVERIIYKIKVGWMRKDRGVRASFKEKEQESRSNYAETLKEREDFLKLITKQPMSEEIELRQWLLPYLDQQLEKARHEIRKWEQLLAEPKKDDGSLQKAKEHPIEDLYDFQKVRRSGGHLTALCPFHDEKNPSFVIYLQENRFYCFGACARGGDAADFVQMRDGCSLPEAIGILNG